ncbi:MAG: ATP-grasp domain-containing protein [Oscillospiraceae bacterium]|nr:ATP-grasp domain-containing protein [Oscillospiraceae bacterium]
MDYKNKKLLILCGNVVHVKVVEAAKEMGVYTIVTDGLPLKDAPAKQIADEALYIDVLDVDALVQYCKENRVDGVINFCNDIGQRPFQQICEALNFPCFGNAEQFFKLTDKNAFKAMCAQYGVDVIPQYDEADLANGNVEYPVLVKPVDSRGSRGQSVCHTASQLQAALEIAKKESTNGKAIVEKYMAGKQDFTMSYVLKDGEAYLTRTANRYLGKEEDGLNKQCICAVSPSANSDLYLEKVHPRVVKALQGIGLKNAPVFMQGFIDGDTVRFYDPGLRFPGAEYEKLLRRATGINLMKEMISVCLGGQIDDYGGELANAYNLDGKVSIQLLISARAGTIGVFDGLDEIEKHPDVVTVAQRYFVGETVVATGDVKQRICEIVVLADRKNAKDTVKWIQSRLVVLDDKGENMLVSQFDPELL